MRRVCLRWVLTGMAVILISGCAGAPLLQSSKIALTSQALAPGSQTVTSTALIFRTATITSVPKPTSTVTAEMFAISSPTIGNPTVNPFIPAVPTQPTFTPATSGTDAVETVVATNQPKVRASYPSPDGKWQVDVTVYNECTENNHQTPSYEELVLVDLASGSQSPFEGELLNCGGIGAGGLDGLFWSANSRYFYYSTAAFSSPDGCAFGWTRPITRLEVDTMVTEYRTGIVSPDHSLITSWGGNTITVWEVESDQETELDTADPAGSVIGLAWAPDGKGFVYLENEPGDTDMCIPSGKSTVVRVDLPSYTQQVLLTADASGYDGVGWDQPDSIRLSDLQGNQWRYNLVTRELTQG